jgi:hypothetical protein
MFKGNKKLIYIFFAVILVIVALQYFLPKPIDWSRTYLSKNKSPFGCYAIYNLLEKTYSNNFSINSQTLYNVNNRGEKNTSLLIVNDNIDFNKNDINALYEFLGRGNKVFIASSEYKGSLADSLHLKAQFDFFDMFNSFDSLVNKKGETIQFTATNIKRKYQYSQVALPSSFRNYDSTKFKLLSHNQKGFANLIHASINSGDIYLMSMPDVFGNYFIANHPNRELTYTLLSLIKNENLIWDEYYKTYNINNYSPIKFILESDALYSAYCLMIFTIIFYMIFEGRRRQRAIPVLSAPENTTLQFVNVISHVYFNSKSHQSIAAERVKYFYETVRKKFNVPTNIMNDEVINEVSELSGIEKKLVQQLFNYCERLKKADEISELDLIELNRQIHNFNKNSLR